ncbi:MAG TPA: AI-2E family transporter [Gemmatimonadales bacterium]|jgi:predicted PurR-regulated permease PerM
MARHGSDSTGGGWLALVRLCGVTYGVNPPARRVPSLRSPVALTIIAALLAIGALFLARSFFIPIALALCFHALLRPMVRWLEHTHLPTPLGAAVVVIVIVVLAVGAVWAISIPAQNWASKAPTALTSARRKLATLRRPFQRISEAAEGKQDGHPAGQPAAPPPSPEPAGPSLMSRILGATTSLIATLAEVILLTYLMLATGDLFLRKLVRVLPETGDKRTATEVLHATESIVARWLLLAATINAGQGIAVGIAVKLLGMPDPLVWGLLTFVLEFVPYLGAATMITLLGISAFTVFPTIGHALVIPGVYLLITTLQNNLVSPILFGGRLKLNPVAVLICVLFWWFLWGVPGAFLAIPITATLKVLGDEVPRLAPLAEFLGD